MLNVAITGTTSGLGEVMAMYLRENLGNNVRTYSKPEFDLSHSQGRHAMLKNVMENFNNLDLLINNAGILILEEEKAEWTPIAKMIQVNLITVWELSIRLHPLLQRAFGQIINIASVAGMNGDEDAPLYAGTKAGVIAITKSLAKAYAPEVRVNCISPGLFNTKLVPGAAPTYLIDSIPLDREAHPLEIIPVLDYLLNSKYTTGSNIVIDGGQSL